MKVMKSTSLPSLAMAVLLTMVIATSLLGPSMAEDIPPSITVTIEEGDVYQTKDVSSGQATLRVRGLVDVVKDTVKPETVHMTVEGTEWDLTISPTDRQVSTTHDSFTFTATILVPTTATEGEHSARVVATWYDIDGVPHSSSATFRVKVVKVPFIISADPSYMVMDAGQSRYVTITISDRTVTGATYLCRVGDVETDIQRPVDWLDWLVTLLDVVRVDVTPGETGTVTLEVGLPANITSGMVTVPIRVEMEGHPDYARTTVVTVQVRGVPVAPPGGGGDGDGSWLPFDPVYLWFIAGLALIVGLVGVLGFTEVGMLAVLWTLLLPLFTRLKRQEVLNQFTRGEIYGFIQANPGVHLTAIKENLGLANGVLAYHLKVLVREEYVIVRREGGYKRFYPRDMKVPRKRVHFTRLQLDIIEKLNMHPGMTQASLARTLGESKQVISYNISVLLAAEVVRVERTGGKTLCYVSEGSTWKPQMAELVEEDEEETGTRLSRSGSPSSRLQS